MSDIAVGDTVRRVDPCTLASCSVSWHRPGWEGIVFQRGESSLYFGGDAQGDASRYERVQGPEPSEPDPALSPEPNHTNGSQA